MLRTHPAIEKEIAHFMDGLTRRNPGEHEFHQAVHEVIESLMPFIMDNPQYHDAQILERMTEPDRIIIFRVSWEDRDGHPRANRAWRVQFNNAIGPYKGGLRFGKDVTLSVLKFLAFEQVFKNSLTGLPMGGGKGGSNFNPKGKTDREVMRFCHSLMIGLQRHIGEDTDVPAGDIGVGAREISFMFGQYLRLANRFTGVMTGKGLAFGGSLIRTEATGYGCVYFTEDMLATRGDGIEGKTAIVSGSGNVALYTIEKLVERGVRVVTVSDSDGFIHDPDGIRDEKLVWLRDLKERRRGRVREYADEWGCDYYPGAKPWGVRAELAFPSATQNEITGEDAGAMIHGGLIAVAEGANMPSDLDAVHIFRSSGILYAPSKAANAGGVAVSGLEQSQNSQRISWTRDEVDGRLRKIIKDIHDRCVVYGARPNGTVDYLDGANIGGFIKVADAMLAYGIV